MKNDRDRNLYFIVCNLLACYITLLKQCYLKNFSSDFAEQYSRQLMIL